MIYSRAFSGSRAPARPWGRGWLGHILHLKLGPILRCMTYTLSWTLETNADQGNMTYNTDLAQYMHILVCRNKNDFCNYELFVKFRKENVRSMVKLRPHTGAIASTITLRKCV